MEKTTNLSEETEKYFQLLIITICNFSSELLQKLEQDLAGLLSETEHLLRLRTLKLIISEEFDALRTFLQTKDLASAASREKIAALRWPDEALVDAYFSIVSDFFLDHAIRQETKVFRGCFKIIEVYRKAYVSVYRRQYIARILKNQSQLHDSLLETVWKQADERLLKEREEHQAK